MPIKAIFTECNSPMWLDIAERLAREQDWRPVYWVGAEDTAPELARRFPEVVFHSKIAAIRGLAAPACAGLAPAPLEQDYLIEMAACEGLVLRMFDRMDPVGAFSFRERLDLYHRYLAYWTAVLERYQPQVALFSIAPHMGYDYVLYDLCLRRGIPTLMLEQVIINSRLYPLARFDDQQTVVTRRYQELLAQDQGGPIALSAEMEEHLASLTQEYKPPFYVARMQRASLLGGGLDGLWLGLKSLPARAKTWGEKAWRVLTTPAPPNHMKVRGRRFQDKPISHLGFEYYLWWGRRARARLKAQYAALASPPDLGRPYIYLPLHYQPEMSTLPTGGLYEDQRLLAGLVASCLPPGWRLYVKEHPFQVSALGRGQQSRPQGYYQDLLALPQVSLVPLGQSSYELIDHAQATVTITGQAAWEAVNRGKPALVFGSAWYRGCEGVFPTTSRDAFQQALEQIRAGYRVDPRKVRLFVQAIEQVTRQGYVERLFAQEYGLDPAENIATVSRLLGDFWRQEILGQG